jgi:hypothetical protein
MRKNCWDETYVHLIYELNGETIDQYILKTDSCYSCYVFIKWKDVIIKALEDAASIGGKILELSVCLTSKSTNPGFHLEKDFIAALAKYECSIDFDTYRFPQPEEDDPMWSQLTCSPEGTETAQFK